MLVIFGEVWRLVNGNTQQSALAPPIALINDGCRQRTEGIMPRDGTLPTYEQDDARREWIKAANRVATGYYYATEMIPGEAPSGARKLMKAAHSVFVLDVLETMFNNGEYWCQHQARNGMQYCLSGALYSARGSHTESDHTGIYLSRAITQLCGKRMKIVDFNDGRENYAEIRAAIVLARELAKQVIDTHIAQLELPSSAAQERSDNNAV
jgi:hypothetical protein